METRGEPGGEDLPDGLRFGEVPEGHAAEVDEHEVPRRGVAEHPRGRVAEQDLAAVPRAQEPGAPAQRQSEPVAATAMGRAGVHRNANPELWPIRPVSGRERSLRIDRRSRCLGN